MAMGDGKLRSSASAGTDLYNLTLITLEPECSPPIFHWDGTELGSVKVSPCYLQCVSVLAPPRRYGRWSHSRKLRGTNPEEPTIPAGLLSAARLQVLKYQRP